ncbi:MAG: hypothetical protein AAF368_01245, partial [Planctomycetota bacterium]
PAGPVPAPAPAPTPQAPTTRESMWPAPTAEDWAKPCLITFQRSYEDALAVSKETGRAILVCVNMDGEPASEHYAGIRYRQPEIAALYQPYVCVVASVYRHTPFDYDENGERMLCPRFGSVTCGEHIAIEPILFEKYFEGTRVAPRHIAIEEGKEEVYDVYYAFDTDSVFNAIAEGVEHKPTPDLRADRSVEELATSREITDRRRVEAEYAAGNKETRLRILQSVAQVRDVSHSDLLRQALLGDGSPDLRALAWQALLSTASSDKDVDLIAELLKQPISDDERNELITVLDKLGETLPRARVAANIQKGLRTNAGAVDVSRWSSAIEAAAERPDGGALPERSVLEARLGYTLQIAKDNPEDAEARLEVAESYLVIARRSEDAKFARLMLEDARREAERAMESGASRARAHTVLALVADKFGDRAAALKHAELAVPDITPDVQNENAIDVLSLFATARRDAIFRALRRKMDWPGEWLADANAAYAILAKHPRGTDAQVVEHFDLLRWLGAGEQSTEVLFDGIDRFPNSWILHDRLRGRALSEQRLDGPAGLERLYTEMLRAEEAHPSLRWFAGYASLVAAEFYRRAGENEAALESYGRAEAYYESHIAAFPGERSTADHYIAMAHGGRARIAYELEQNDVSLEQILASFARKPDAAASLDGLNLSAVDTAKMLRARFKELGDTASLDRLQIALDALDPAMLLLPEYEPRGPSGPSPDARRFRGRGGRWRNR